MNKKITMPLQRLCFVLFLLISAGCETFEKFKELEQGKATSENPRVEELETTMTVQRLIKKMRKATDPNGLYRNCKTYLQKQQLSVKSGGGTITYGLELRFKKPTLFNTTTYRDNEAIQTILYNGKNVWTIDPATGKNQQIKGKIFALVKMYSDLGNPSNTLTDVFEKIEISLVRIFDGKKTDELYKLICHSKDENIPIYTLYVDRRTSLTKKLETVKFTKDGSYKFESVIDKYAMYRGVMIASETTVTINDKIKQNYTVVDYKLDVDIPDSVFELPKRWYLDAVTEKQDKK